jgi:phosphatidylinositol glycan class V
LVIFGVAKCVSCVRASTGRHHISKAAVKVISSLLFYGGLASLVALPLIFHDRRGYNFHCLLSKPQPQSLIASWNPPIPEWCEHNAAGTGRRFSLYAHVQRKYWNVGLFRYYELKQIPNFLLAAPLLILSFTAAVVWIAHSWNHIMPSASKSDRGSNAGINRLFARSRAFLRWVYLAIDASTNKSSDGQSQSTILLLIGPTFLSYYAILAGFALVGTFIAHVQISTRLICSSCPAIYWFWTCLLVKDGRVKDNSGDGVISLFPFDSHIARLLFPYFVLFNILGVVLHVNFLPWT